MENKNEIKSEKPAKFSSAKRHLIFFFVLFALIGGAILRSSIATRLGGFTFDEAYHIGAGAAYVKTGDFRLNPEHPPLVKLWTGVFVAEYSIGWEISPKEMPKEWRAKLRAGHLLWELPLLVRRNEETTAYFGKFLR